MQSNTSQNKDDLSTTQQSLLQSLRVPDQVEVDLQKTELSEPEIIEMNNTFDIVNKIYQDVLSPQLEKNEKLKRKHKTLLMNNIFKILNIQFRFMYVFMFILLIGIILSNHLNISDSIIGNIIDLLKFYIASIIVELLSILFFIVKNVFDKSIVDLIKNFDKQNKNKKKITKDKQ